ncbi:hypothetical protein [Bacillus seohaeanensis]|uniref:DUF3953 domain-containing protein n=1 Tax=Bacillus seohaeanensis TaxID=284580 RepID=A0ABW5RUL3_9BACI
MKKYFVFLSVIVVGVSLYGLITNKDALLPYALLGLGIVTLISGIREVKQKQEMALGIVNIFTSSIAFCWVLFLVFI